MNRIAQKIKMWTSSSLQEFFVSKAKQSIISFLWAAFVAFILILMSPIVTGRIFTENDLGTLFLPTRYIYWKALHAGDSLLYTSQLFGGFYLQGEGQLGSFHPLHLLLYSTLPFLVASAVHITAIMLAYFGGTYLFFRSWLLSRSASFFGAVIFVFGSIPMTKYFHLPVNEVLCHIPWLLIAIERIANEKKLGRKLLWVAAVTLLTTSQTLIGYPPSVYLTLIIEAWYLLLVCSKANLPQTTLLFGAAKLFAVGLSFTQLLPTLYMAEQSSNRAVRDFEFLSVDSFYPGNLLQWLNPFFNLGARWEQSIYTGTGVLLLAIWTISRKPESIKEARRRNMLLGLAAFAMFLSLGKFNLLFNYYSSLPVLNMFRVPSRHLLLFVFPLIVFAALIFDEVCNVRNWPQKTRFVEVSAVLLLIGSPALLIVRFAAPAVLQGLLAYASSPLTKKIILRAESLLFASMADASTIVVGAGLVMITAGSFLLGLRGGLIARYLFLIMLVAEPFSIQLAHLANQPREYLKDPEVTGVQGDPPVSRPGPLVALTILGNDKSLLSGYRYINSYAGFRPKSYLPDDSPRLWELFGVSAVLYETGWKKVEPFKPVSRMHIVSDVRYSGNPANDVLALDLSTQAIVDRPVAVPAKASGSVKVVVDRPGEIQIESETDGAVVGYLTERFHQSWKVLVDGVPQQSLRVNAEMLGVLIPGGKHIIHFQFSPDEFWLSVKITAISAAIFLAFMGFTFVQLYRERRQE